MSLVIDASITLAWLFKDERTDKSRLVFDEVLAKGAVVPVLWRFEIANSLQMAVRRRRILPVDRDESLIDLAALRIEVDTEGMSKAWSASVQLAEKHGLTIYDAAYLELAQRRRLKIATMDNALFEAARSELLPAIGL